MNSSFKLVLVVALALISFGCGRSRVGRNFPVRVNTYFAEEVWCEGGTLEQESRAPFDQAKWHGTWSRLPCSTVGRDYQVTECLTASHRDDSSLRFRCFAKFHDGTVPTCQEGIKSGHIIRIEPCYAIVDSDSCQID